MVMNRLCQRSAVAALILAVTACGSGPERPGAGPTEPLTSSDVAGTYRAISMLVTRDSGYKELVGEPDTRLDLHLDPNGAAHGQLKIGTDPQLRDKRSLVGNWQFRMPSHVIFQFRPSTFLNETAFQVVAPGQLSGEWLGSDVSLKIKLEKIH